jgi:hypothetical protein
MHTMTSNIIKFGVKTWEYEYHEGNFWYNVYANDYFMTLTQAIEYQCYINKIVPKYKTIIEPML